MRSMTRKWPPSGSRLDTVHADDAGVPQAGQGSGLVAEAGHRPWAAQQPLVRHLDRHRSAIRLGTRPDTPCPCHRRPAAFAERHRRRAAAGLGGGEQAPLHLGTQAIECSAHGPHGAAQAGGNLGRARVPPTAVREPADAAGGCRGQGGRQFVGDTLRSLLGLGARSGRSPSAGSSRPRKPRQAATVAAGAPTNLVEGDAGEQPPQIAALGQRAKAPTRAPRRKKLRQADCTTSSGSTRRANCAPFGKPPAAPAVSIALAEHLRGVAAVAALMCRASSSAGTSVMRVVPNGRWPENAPFRLGRVATALSTQQPGPETRASKRLAGNRKVGQRCRSA